jgi:uncharacterized membrane protein
MAHQLFGHDCALSIESAARVRAQSLNWEQRTAHRGYLFEFIVLVGGLIYGAYLIHIPHTWIIVGALVFIGLGIMSAVSHTKRRDPPAEAPRAPDA